MKNKAILLNLRYTQDFRGQGATTPTPFGKLQRYSATDLGKIPTSFALHSGTLGPSLWTNTFAIPVPILPIKKP